MFLTNLPSPYRIDFFNELGKISDLTVVFERSRSTSRDSRWRSVLKETNFNEVYIKGVNIGDESSISLGAIRLIKRNNYDAIVISGYSSITSMLTILYLNICKIPFILSVDGGIIGNESKFKYNLKKYLISKASLWLSTGKATTDYLIHYGAKREKINVYPFTSIKKSDIRISIPTLKSNYKEKLGMKEKKIILSVGQFIYRKGYDVLLEACSKMDKDIGVYIVGGSPPKEYTILKEKFKLDNVYFIDFKTKSELSDYYMAADLFILPTREDIWGLVINEAMAHGLPIITTENCVAGLELVLSGENGYIIPVNNSKEIIDKTIGILADENLQLSMSEKSLDIISNYTIENMAMVCYKIFKQSSFNFRKR
ncbi:glycosyltransferase family 4 protein [Neobacillus niacini]|uniref:glycosyltransferase family 4 protein n=1 Tax=Neobacillus niacini TaxID=86668 RepID=UPI00286AB6EC|nr:glycosyltransferase family 4 protein [Neobacillus niacini]